MKKMILCAMFLAGTCNLSLLNAQEMSKAQYRVEGMNCEHCVSNVKQTLRKQSGVRKVDADLEKKVITITYDAQKISPEKMILSLNATKRYIPTTYSVSDVITRVVSYRSDDMKCANCAKKVEKAIQTYAGVDSVGVDLDKKVVTVKYDANKVSKSTFEQTFDKLGYLTTTFYPNEIVGYARYTVKAGKLDEESKQQLIDNVEGLVELSSIPTSNVIAVAYDKRTLKDADAVKAALEGKGYSLDIQ